MGGIGSNRWKLKEKRKYIDQSCNIDINVMNKQNALFLGAKYSINWGEKDHIINSIAITVRDKYLEVMYQQKGGQRDGALCETRIDLTFSLCNYGGRRPWFLCPYCDGRVTKLYHLEPGFICRKCSKLPYQSQSETRFDRARYKAGKIRGILGVEDDIFSPVLTPPKGMCWKTFDRLYKQLKQAEKICLSEMGKTLDAYSSQSE